MMDDGRYVAILLTTPDGLPGAHAGSREKTSEQQDHGMKESNRHESSSSLAAKLLL
jgi:hypothetical protein